MSRFLRTTFTAIPADAVTYDHRIEPVLEVEVIANEQF